LYFNSDEKSRVLIGEAAIHLALTEQEINVETLIHQLTLMARKETSGPRLALIHAACEWLSDSRALSSQHIEELNWHNMSHDEPQRSSSDNVVRLTPNSNDE